MSDLIHKVTQDNFKQEVLDNPIPVLVDFWAEWCPPCKALGKTLEALAPEVKDKVKICKVDVEENPQLAAQFNIRNIPFIALVVNGQKVADKVGNQSKEDLLKMIESASK